jgi:hypothetical protein
MLTDSEIVCSESSYTVPQLIKTLQTVCKVTAAKWHSGLASSEDTKLTMPTLMVEWDHGPCKVASERSPTKLLIKQQS